MAGIEKVAVIGAGIVYGILRAGRYLAGDWGGTVEIGRRFDSGIEVGGFIRRLIACTIRLRLLTHSKQIRQVEHGRA